MRAVIDPRGFEAKFRQNIDPWNYARSPFEAFKRARLLQACGPGPFGRALELACANGLVTEALAPRCLRLTAVDAAPTALREAARRLVDQRHVRFALAVLPDEMPRGPFDLIVVSEILYYLRPKDLRRLVSRLEKALAPGGRIVLLHHLTDFEDAAVRPRAAQGYAVLTLGRRLQTVLRSHAGRFQAVALARGRQAPIAGRRPDLGGAKSRVSRPSCQLRPKPRRRRT